MENLRHFRDITREFPELQGLRLLPLGLFFLVVSAQRLEVLPWLGEQGDLSLTLPLLVLVPYLWFLIGRYYARTFGTVEPLGRKGVISINGVLLLVGTLCVIVLENILYARHMAPPVSLMGLYIAAAFLSAGWAGRRWYHLLAGALLLVSSCLPLIMGVGLGHPLYGSLGVVYLFTLGVAMLVCGLIDHLRLVRAFPPGKEAKHAGDA